ncbi:MAG: CNNM domain-containing protein [Anaerohalosphaeraceae bacterium]|nr:CNNM domain-containing protein [Anaerohalosphaeraceae bacterium]
MSMLIKILLVILSIAPAAFFAGAETGMYRLSRFYIRLGIEKNQRFFKTLGSLFDDTHGVIFSLLIGNNLAHFFVTSLVTVMLVKSMGNSHSAELYATVIMTPILFVFSELIPKNLFIYHADFLMPPVSPLLWIFHRFFVLTGIVPMLKMLANLISKITKSHPASQPAIVAVYRHQISQIASETIEEGILTPVQTKIINRLVNIPDVKITEVITPLSKVRAVSINAGRGDLLEELKKSDYTRFAVYQDFPSNIIGYINIYRALGSEDFSDVKSFLNPIIKLHSAISVSEALDVLKKENQKIALVIDKKTSRVLGVVTIKDLVEEFVGELTGI